MKPVIGSHVKYTHYIPATAEHPSGIVTDNAIVIGIDGETVHLAYVDDWDKPRLHLLAGADWNLAFDRALNVPTETNKGDGHNFFAVVNDVNAEEVATMKKMVSNAQKTQAEINKLVAFLMGNFKSETGNETPVDCAIRLLSKVKKPSK